MKTPAGRQVIRKQRGRRDPEASRAAILQAALNEFSSSGYDGARVDRIADAAGVSKPLIYDYFGDKDDLYAAALREAYLQIRSGEGALDLEAMEPREAIEELVAFTLNHFRENPWFIAMLNTENLRGGETVQKMPDRRVIQSNLLSSLENVLARGREQAIFKRDVSATRIYLLIASLCYFPVSNRFTLEAVFEFVLDDEQSALHAETVASLLLTWLSSEES